MTLIVCVRVRTLAEATLNGELLLRVGGTRKINVGLERVGVKIAKNVMLFTDCEKKEVLEFLDAKELKPTFVPDEKKIIAQFKLSEKMRSKYSIEQCVLERVAMSGLE